MLKKIIFIISFLIVSQSAFALTDAEQKNLLQYIAPILGDEIKPDQVKESPIPGLYLVVYGANVFYISADGRYILEQPSMIDLKTRTNLTEEMWTSMREKVLSTLDEKQMVVYTPKETKHTITVFTDIDCPYCQKLHRERNTLLENGIKLRYMLYPRSGVDTKSYKTSAAVMCSKDPAAAMTKAKEIAAFNGRQYAESKTKGTKPDLRDQITADKCDDPVKDHMAALHKMGIEVATPQIIFSDGNMVRGYVPADKLVKILNEKDKSPKDKNPKDKSS